MFFAYFGMRFAAFRVDTEVATRLTFPTYAQPAN